MVPLGLRVTHSQHVGYIEQLQHVVCCMGRLFQLMLQNHAAHGGSGAMLHSLTMAVALVPGQACDGAQQAYDGGSEAVQNNLMAVLNLEQCFMTPEWLEQDCDTCGCPLQIWNARLGLSVDQMHATHPDPCPSAL